MKYLLDKNCSLTVIGHKGRPEGKPDPSLSVLGFKKILEDMLNVKDRIVVLENLRFDSGEEANDFEFAKKLASHGDFFVNEAFATSHRVHSSIVSLPKLLPHAAGLRFVAEVENLSKIFENPRRPVVVLISGVKEEKLSYIEPFKRFADKILVSGRLPKFLEGAEPSGRVVIARLTADGGDITVKSMEIFENEIAGAGTIVVSGPMGRFEEEGHRQGTERVLTAVSNSSAFKLAGGGDTTNAINMFNLVEKFDWISVGGGAMLDFLANHTLPGIEALIN
jgi:phosphoglycerate kinase